MTAPVYPFSVRVVEPLTVLTESDVEMVICAGTVLDVLYIERADPSAGIRSNTVTFVDPSDIGCEVYADGIEWPSQEMDDGTGELVTIDGDVEPWSS